MQYTIPDYYKEFTCIADKCEDTCCAGWKIVIDKKSLNKYKHVKGKFWFYDVEIRGLDPWHFQAG